MSSARLIIGLPIAGAITLGLFVMMSSMITNDGVEEGEVREVGDLFARADIPKEQAPTSQTLNEVPKTLPSPPEPITTTTIPNEGRPNPLPTQPTPIDPPRGTDGFSTGSYHPIVRVEPTFPANCASRSPDGSVLVEFDLNPDGSVSNPRIISSSASCFNRSVLRAVRKWKYSAPGRKVTGLRTNIRFELTE